MKKGALVSKDCAVCGKIMSEHSANIMSSIPVSNSEPFSAIRLTVSAASTSSLPSSSRSRAQKAVLADVVMSRRDSLKIIQGTDLTDQDRRIVKLEMGVNKVDRSAFVLHTFFVGLE